ncbi:hypothetical protein ANCCEY_10419 [Ancylostoma ceylanicum]|uniref:CN hydrolase domain-containing protein n=1 Tax=Ancylostoma ceylanicum TaxID=53326 RepID=A0A0D6LKG1_9BILA|nr:hypothetical protein ANCCEY_10419 [Ancylostoma ceylanicum]
MSSTFDFESVDEALKAIQGPTYDEVHRILYGRRHAELEIPKEALEIASKNNFDMRAYEITAEPEQLRAPRKVRVAAIQFAIVLPTNAPIEEQRKAIHHKVATMIDAAAAAGANIVCMHELWTMPFAFCTRERLPWTEFAESAEHGPSTKFLSQVGHFETVGLTARVTHRLMRDS